MVRPDAASEFRRCFDQHWAAVCRSLARRGAGSQTEDLAAEAFTIAWRKWHAVPEDPLPWVLRTALNLLANARRRDRRELPLEFARAVATGGHDAHGTVSSQQEVRAILAALAALSPLDREAVVLTAWDLLTPAQAAVVCNCSPGAFRVRLHRARTALKLATATDLPPNQTVTRA